MVKVVQVSAIDGTMNKGLKALNKGLINKGYEVYGICSPGPNTQEILNDGINLINVQIDRKIGLSNIKSIYQLKKQLEKIKPDIVHVHTPIASVLARIAAKLAKVPNVVYTAHGFYFHENMSKMKYNFYYYIEKVMARFFTDYIFTQSQEDADLSKDKKFLDSEKIVCIGNGVDVEKEFNPSLIKESKVKALYNEFNLQKDEIIITFVGRLVREKGIFELLEAFQEIQYPKVKLLIIGSPGQSERDTETALELKKYKGINNIIFTGKRTDVNNILYISDIFCLPSYREGMPRSIIEAMAMENAIIATNIRGSREEVDHGKTGYLVPLYDSHQIANKINKLINDSEKLKVMKKAGREKALKLYNEDRVIKHQLKIFEKIISEIETNNN